MRSSINTSVDPVHIHAQSVVDPEKNKFVPEDMSASLVTISSPFLQPIRHNVGRHCDPNDVRLRRHEFEAVWTCTEVLPYVWSGR